MVPPPDRYETDDADFDAEHGVLGNRLAMTDPSELEPAENHALMEAYDRAAMEYTETHLFTADANSGYDSYDPDGSYQ